MNIYDIFPCFKLYSQEAVGEITMYYIWTYTAFPFDNSEEHMRDHLLQLKNNEMCEHKCGEPCIKNHDGITCKLWDISSITDLDKGLPKLKK